MGASGWCGPLWLQNLSCCSQTMTSRCWVLELHNSFLSDEMWRSNWLRGCQKVGRAKRLMSIIPVVHTYLFHHVRPKLWNGEHETYKCVRAAWKTTVASQINVFHKIRIMNRAFVVISPSFKMTNFSIRPWSNDCHDCGCCHPCCWGWDLWMRDCVARSAPQFVSFLSSCSKIRAMGILDFFLAIIYFLWWSYFYMCRSLSYLVAWKIWLAEPPHPHIWLFLLSNRVPFGMLDIARHRAS